MKSLIPKDLHVDTLQSEPACWAPWMTIYIQQSTDIIAPCCAFGTKTSFNSIEDYTHSTFFRETAESLRDGKYHPEHCKYCIRHTAINRTPDSVHYDKTITTLAGKTFEDKKTYIQNKGKFVYLDLRPGNLCNLKCRTCNPTQSSEIAKEIKEYGISGKKNSKWSSDQIELLSYRYTTADAEAYKWNEVLKYFDLNYLKALGGEPSIDPHVYKLLEHITNTYTDLPILHITTNATNVNKRWMDLIKNFLELSVNFSIDGAGDVFEYTRYPAKWNSIKTNIEKHISELSINSKNINYVNTILLLLTIEDWIDEFADVVYNNNLDVSYNEVQAVNMLATTILPEYIVSERKETIAQLIDRHPTLAKNLFDPMVCELSNAKEDLHLLKQFFKSMEWHDRIRKQDLYSLSPKFKELRKYVESRIKKINL